MSKILGLDLGTNSIGWAIIDDVIKKIDTGVTTFQRGVNVDPKNGNEAPLNVERRKSRQMRRQVFYKNYRLTKMTEVLARFEMFPYLKILSNEEQQKAVINEIKDRYLLNDQQLKNHKLNKYKDGYQLNARIAKFLLQFGHADKTSLEVNLNENPQNLLQFNDHLLAFISMNPYRLRSLALTKEISLIELGRILYQIGKRRGFKSSRKVKNKDEGGDKTTRKKFKKNDRTKDWETEIGNLREKYGEELEVIEETDVIIEVAYPKALTEFYEKIDKTRKAIEEGKHETLGNYLFHKNSHIERIRQETKADRSLYIQEFNHLWNKHADRLGLNVQSGIKRKKKKEWVEIALKEFIGDPIKGILFYQRPLKSQKHLVAKCTFANKTIRLRDLNTYEIQLDNKEKEQTRKVGKSRCLISHPLYERFRALQQINNLKIKRFGVWEELAPDERNRLCRLFITGCNESGKVAISKVLEELSILKDQLKGAAEGDVEAWEDDKNSNDEKKHKVKGTGSFAGNYTVRKLGELFQKKWDNFNEFSESVKKNIQEKTIIRIGGENIQHDKIFRTKNKDERKNLILEKGNILWTKLTEEEKVRRCLESIQDEIWHCFTFYEDNDLLFEKMKYYGLEEDKKDNLRRINLKDGYGSLSLKAINKVLPFMEEGLKYTDAIFLANVDEVFGKSKWLAMSSVQRQTVNDDIKKLVREKQEEKAEIDLKNAVLTAIKKEHEKLPKPVQSLDSTRVKYWTRSKGSKYFKEKKGLNGNEELEEAITKYATELTLLLKNPLKPEFLKTEPVIEQIETILKKKYSVNENRFERLWHPSKVEHLPTSPDELQEPKFQTLRNPIVKQALYALRNVVKNIESKHGKPDIVRIELTRELNDKNKRIAIRKWNKQQEKKRNDIKNRLSEYPFIDSNNEENIQKYKLWQELLEINGCYMCPYTGAVICFDDLFGKNKFQIEHIIPKERCWSDAEVNLTLCATNFNEYKKNRTPYELQECESDANYKQEWRYAKILDRIKGWKQKAEKLDSELEALQEELKGMPTGNARDGKMQKKHLLSFERNYFRSKYRRFEIDNMRKQLNEDENFLKSLITDTSYISKLAAIYLKSYFGEHKVQTVKGATTSMLRQEWDLGNKNRDNHFHHAEDAIIIAFTSLSIYQELAQHRKKEKEKGALYHPWGITQFKDKFIKTIQNISVYDKQRDKKITKYKKTLHQKGSTQKIEITSVRGALHEANSYKKINGGAKYSKRRPFVDLSPENRKNNIPDSLKRSWEPIDEIKEQRQLKSVKIKGIERPVPLSRFMFSQIALIEDDTIKELIKKRLEEKGIADTGIDEIIPKEVFFKKLSYTVVAKGKGEIIKCEIKIVANGKVKIENRKLTKAKEGKKQSGKLLCLNEISWIVDEAIKNAVISCLKTIVKDPGDIEKLKKELGDDQYNQFQNAVQNESFDLDIPMPSVFFEKKIRTSLSSFGIPIKKVTLKGRGKNGKRVRKKIEDLTYGDISKLTEPAKTIIEQRLKDINEENGNALEKLPDEFYEGYTYMPVKNVRTHEEANLFLIRNRGYFRFGNTDHAIIYQDTQTKKYYTETVPFYFVINPDKYDESTRLGFFQGVGKREIERGDFNPGRLKAKLNLKNGDYFVLNTEIKDGDSFRKEVNDQITRGENFKLKENLFKVVMISATAFQIKFRKHYSVKAGINQEEVLISSSDLWENYNPIKVKLTPLGKIEFLNNW